MKIASKSAARAFAVSSLVFTLLLIAIGFAPTALAANVTLTYDSNTTQHQPGVISSGAVPSPGVFAQNTTATVSANSGNLSLNAFAGAGNSTVYVAFKYTSSTTASSTWEVDNVKVTGN